MCALAAVSRLVAGASLIALLGGAAAPPIPLFSPAANVGWIAYGPEFIPVGNGPKPVTFDPQHPFINNGIEYNAARPGTQSEELQSTFPVADLSNPILQPWVRDELRKLNERVLAGRPLYSRQSSCWPTGVPGFLFYVVNPVFFLQTPKEVVIIATSDHMVRHVHLNVRHTADPKPSWYGESIGHYEGDTLVVDTIALNDKTFVDAYRTPHTAKIHVTERWRLIDNGDKLEVLTTIDDPDTFNQPWQALRRYQKAKREFVENICSENNSNLFDYGTPTALKPDF